MPRTHRPYPPAFRAEAARLVLLSESDMVENSSGRKRRAVLATFAIRGAILAVTGFECQHLRTDGERRYGIACQAPWAQNPGCPDQAASSGKASCCCC